MITAKEASDLTKEKVLDLNLIQANLWKIEGYIRDYCDCGYKILRLKWNDRIFEYGNIEFLDKEEILKQLKNNGFRVKNEVDQLTISW